MIVNSRLQEISQFVQKHLQIFFSFFIPEIGLFYTAHTTDKKSKHGGFLFFFKRHLSLFFERRTKVNIFT